jgi:hypothetical protein
MKGTKHFGRALLLGGALALAACSGTDGAPGANGANGTNGTNGVNGVVGKLSLSIDGVETVTSTATLTFTVRPAAAVCPGGVCDPTLGVLGQKTFYAQEWNAAANTFDTKKNFSFTGIQFKGVTADGNGAQYTARRTNVSFAPELSAHAFVYGYIATKGAVPVPTTGHYNLPSSVSSAAKVYGTIGYTSTVNVSGCETCHGKPYSKHGYRQAKVAGVPELPDMATCKVCHTDQRVGADGQWYVFADDPANYDPDVWDTVKYAYTANIMNDTHNSHAFEFNYPQSMANCVTCHAGKLGQILTDANFKPSVCKSCHPVNGFAGTQDGRAPSFAVLWATSLGVHTDPDLLYTTYGDADCNGCHSATGAAKSFTFSKLHRGYNNQIYSDANGTRYASSIKATVVSASYDAASYVSTVTFSVSGVSSTAIVSPTVVASLYGYDTKDFIVSGHSSQFADKTPNLEWTEGAVIRGTTTPANTTRLVVTPGTATAGNASWTATLDLSTWSGMITAGQVKRIEVGFLPAIGLDPTTVATSTNPGIAVVGVTQTINVTATSATAYIKDADSYGKTIVDPTKCNACHDALGTTFHTPNYGSAGTVGCRLCHVVGSAGSHLEMQSRSIDSYVHAIHRMEVLDGKNVNLTDKVQKVRYDKHVEGVYPNFAGWFNCESCHNAGMYDPPAEDRSMPSLLSALGAPTGRTGLGTFAQQITGPAARACGGCHRAAPINEADGSKLVDVVAHWGDFGSAVADPTALVSTAAYLQYMTGASKTFVAPPAGAQVETCTICHATAGSDHQAQFNIWKSGL